MSFLDHLEELRTRIIRALIVVAVTFVVCWAFVEQLYVIVAGSYPGGSGGSAPRLHLANPAL